MGDDYEDYDDDQSERCPRCDGAGEVDCHCGGDLCVCTNYGEMPCPLCHGEGEVSMERAERYMAGRREIAEALRRLDGGDDGSD